MVLEFIYLISYFLLGVYFIFKSYREIKRENKKIWLFFVFGILFMINGIFSFLNLLYFYILYGLYFVLLVFVVWFFWKK